MQTLDLAVIGNSVVSALIDQRGRYVWHCHPRLDADPIFCLLLDDANGGFMDVELEDVAFNAQAYVENTAILETTLTDSRAASFGLSISRRVTDNMTGCSGRRCWCGESNRCRVGAASESA